MIDISSLVQWWDDWQLRVHVLGSLGLQWFLLLAAPTRKYTVPSYLRKSIWLAYISSDALAIYALATLLDRHARTAPAGQCLAPSHAGPGKEQSRLLEVLWAPVLLIHLGGQEELTAYKIQDTEQWARQALTLVSQVAVALYAFYKSWQPSSADWRLTAAAAVLFAIGVSSFSEKPIALFAAKSAKTKRLAAMLAWTRGAANKPSSVRREDLSQFLLSRLSTLWHALGSGNRSRPQNKEVALSLTDKVLMVLSDMSLPAAAKELVEQRADKVDDLFPPLQLAVAEKEGMAHWLRVAFDLVYTRASVVVTPVYLVYRLVLVPALHVAALTLFVASDKHWYKRADVKITYIVLCLTAAQDFLAVFIRQLIHLLMSITVEEVQALCETVTGYNLVDEAVREADIGCAWSLCRLCHLHGLYREVTETVVADLLADEAWDRDPASFRIFDSPAATITKNWALSKEMQASCGAEIKSSLGISFDRSVLLWHITTDLCFRCIDDGDGQGQGEEEKQPQEQELPDVLDDEEAGGQELQDHEVGARTADGGISPFTDPQGRRMDRALWLHIQCTQAISNYMAHLLDSNPEMLLIGSRRHLISEARDEVKCFLLSNKGTSSDGGCSQLMNMNGGAAAELLSKKDLLKEHIYRIADGREANPDTTEGFFHIVKACKLAKELLQVPDDSTRWRLMYRVWLGMLCYSASMCRAYLHAKILGGGGEFLSYIWLALSLKGAKTLADKLQMPPETQASDDE